MASQESVHILSPAATPISFPPDRSPVGVESNPARKLRVPRSVQLELARTVTFGVLGDDSHLYPSSKWVSENRDNFTGRKPEEPRTKPDFLITSLDTRRHNPQPSQIFHIKRINSQKPVCTVQSLLNPEEEKQGTRLTSSVYKESYRERPLQPFHIVHSHEKDKLAEGIVPLNVSGSQFDVRSEMMLPVCDCTILPSTHNPHRYLLRKRKVPPPWNAYSGTVYPGLEHARMTSYEPGTLQTASLPFPNEMPNSQEKTSISTLSGLSFTRKRFLQPPPSHIFAGFDGGVAETTSTKFDDRYLPFIRAKTII